MLDVMSNRLKTLTDDEKQVLRDKLQAQLSTSLWANALSHAQQRLWVLEQLNQCDYLYHIPIVMALSEPVDTSALQKAFLRLMQANPILTSYFVVQDDEIKQFQASSPDLTIQLLELTEDLPEIVEITTQSAFADFFLEKFNFATPPLFRVAVARTPSCRWLLMCFHHLLIDGWSLQLLLHSLAEEYRDIQAPLTQLNPVSPDSYQDFIVWEKTRHYDAVQLNYWIERLAGKPLVVDTVTDYPRKLTSTGEGKTIHFKLTGEGLDRLNHYAQSVGVSMNQLVLFAFQFLLARYSGQEDIAVGIPVAGRNHPRWHQTLGLFVNTCLHLIKIDYEATVNEQLQHLKEQLLLDIAHANQPFDEIIKRLYAERQVHQHGIFNILYNFIQRDKNDTLISFSDSPCRLNYCLLPTSKFDLSLHGYATPTELDFFFEFSTDLYQARTVQELVQYFLVTLEQLPKAHELTLKKLSSVCWSQIELSKSR